MNRPQGTILQQGSAYGLGTNAPMTDLGFGGQMGWSPDQAAWVSNAAYIRRHLIPILIEAPKLFNYLPNSQAWVNALRGIIETQWLQVDGLARGLETSFTSNPFGGSGQQQQDLTNVKRAESKPKHTLLERPGNPIQRFLEGWILWGGMDPDTKFPMAATLPSTLGLEDLMPDMVTATVLYIEPDQMGRKVNKSWLVFNMFPEGTGDMIGSADKTQDMQTQTVDVQFTGLHQVGAGVDAFAQQILSAITLTGANPNMRQAMVQAISADVRAAQGGFMAGVQNTANQAIIR